jgi:hypothetical protein
MKSEVITEEGGPLAEDLALMGHKKDCGSTDQQRWVWVCPTPARTGGCPCTS